MKKYLIYINMVLFGLLFYSCNKKELTIIRPDKKLIENQNEYTKILTEAEYGWIGYLFPAGGRAYTFKFNFTNENRVFTSGTLDETYTTTGIESSYRLVADQTPSLSFDTYTYLHLLSDPDELIFGGARGRGHVSDFEFAFLKLNKDTIHLKGNHNGSKLILVKATKDQDKDFIKKSFATYARIGQINDFQHYHKKVRINNQDFSFTISPHINAMSFYYMEGDVFKQKIGIFTTNEHGLLFREPMELAGVSFQEITNFDIVSKQNTGTFKINGEKVKIEPLQKPLYIDKHAPNRFREVNKQFYSRWMFTVNGKHEALSLRELPGYAGGVYLSNVNVDRMDAMYLLYISGMRYVGPVFSTIIDQDGVMKFNKYMEAYGFNPGELISVVRRFNEVWFNEAGYYVFQTGPTDYDLVNAKDSKTWVRFN